MTQLNLTLEPEFLKALFLHGNGDAVKKLVEKVIDAVLNVEAEEQVGAALYERTGEARTYRNEYRERRITTRVGTLELHIPKLRNGHFSTELFARYQRNERALMLSLMEMVIQGVSTRKVSAITEKLCGTQFSAQTVSPLCKELDESINVFRNRPLTKAYPFLCAVATYVRQHSEDRGVISVGLFIALGVRLITSDAHCGIQKAIFQSFPGCARQRCRTHFSRNVLDACPSRTVRELKIRLRDIYEAPTLDECRKCRDAILKDFSLSAPKAMKVLEQGWNDIVSVYACPPTLRKKLRTSNAIKRVNGEIKRRENVIRIFPNEGIILRLMGAILMDLHENWAQRKYMDLTELCHWEAEQTTAPMGAMEEGTNSAA